jgi:TonB-dependent receptor
LPSINLNLELIPDELVLYFGAAKVLAHPKAKDLNIAASCTIRLDTASISAGNRNTCRAGNPRLDPYLANQWDLAINWYPNEDSILSAAYFEKKIDTWVIEANENLGQDFFGDGILYDVTQVINGSGITTKGVELSASTFFSSLPGFFGNTGAAANYTYLTADDVGLFNRLTGEELPFPSQSENSYNITLFYETEQLSVKFAYNYRDEYLVDPDDRGGNPVYIADAGILDAKVVYRPASLENLKFHFDVRNLNEEGNQYENGPGRVSEIRYSGREFAAGFTYTF